MRLIDADALAKKLKDHHDFFVNAWGGFGNLPIKDKARVDEITHCIAEVRNAPTIEAEPVRHGRWIDGAENFTCGNHNAECSVCHCNISWSGCDEDFNYCPRCGAKMDGGAADADSV